MQAEIIDSTGNTTAVPLSYSGDPSYFTGEYTFPAAGDYQIGVTALEMNGNCGSSLAPTTVTVT